MKRYMVFACLSYYPSGGMNDFKGDFDSLEDESYLNHVEKLRESNDHIHVYDTELRSIVVEIG